MKKCTRCKQQLPATAFYRDSSRGDGLQNRCKPCSRAWADAYIKKNPTYRVDYYRRNIERHKQHVARWDRENRLERRRIAARRRARKMGARFVPMTRRELRRLYSQACAHCGASENLHRDHITPLSRGGDDTFANSQMLCQFCNCSKGPKLEIEARAYRRLLTREVA
jgi:5-methylcytosine-specific restriction endonuclease McrA